MNFGILSWYFSITLEQIVRTHICIERAFLFTNKIGVPQGDTLGLMKPSQQILQLIFQFLQLNWSHPIGRDGNGLSARKNINCKINITVHRSTRKIHRKHIYEPQITQTDFKNSGEATLVERT